MLQGFTNLIHCLVIGDVRTLRAIFNTFSFHMYLSLHKTRCLIPISLLDKQDLYTDMYPLNLMNF